MNLKITEFFIWKEGVTKSNLNFESYLYRDLLVWVHLGRVRSRGDILLDRPLDRRHWDVGDSTVVESLFKIIPFGRVSHIVVKINL